MKRPTSIEVTVFVALLVCGTLLRLWLEELPNFAPVAAIALFAGFFFRSGVVAAILPAAIMAISDYWIGAYDRPMMLLVYSALMLPVACRSILRRYFGNRPDQSPLKTAAGLLGCTFMASVSFFVISNFGAWLWFDMYERTVAGFIECYVAAIPFFRYTLAGDMFFGLVLFGSYTLATTFAVRAEKQDPVLHNAE